jgi:Gpi18-like mannosyltransferase
MYYFVSVRIVNNGHANYMMKLRIPNQIKSKLSKFVEFIEKHDLALAAIIVLMIVLSGLFIGYSNNGVVPTYPKAHYHYQEESSNGLSFTSNWDGVDYLHIARHGYGHNLFYANFFPLYPVIVYLLNLLIPSTLDSALLISWLCLIGAIYFYINICKQLLNTKDVHAKIGSILPFILFPSGVFLIATYSESLYALMALASIYFALNKKYLRSAILAMLCGLTHITGCFLLVLILLIMLEQKVRLLKVIESGLIGIAGLVSYMVYSAKEFNTPFAFIKSQENQHGWLKHDYFSLIGRADPLNILFIILLIAAIIYWRKRRKSFSIYCFLFLLIPLVGRQYGGFNRYVLMAFPVQFMIYEYTKNKPLLFNLSTIILAVIWTYFVLQYMGGYIGN